jgi:hypothetical protein
LIKQEASPCKATRIIRFYPLPVMAFPIQLTSSWLYKLSFRSSYFLRTNLSTGDLTQ